MVTIRRPQGSGRRGNESTDFIQCINGQKPRSINCGVWVWMGYVAKFILQSLQRSRLELSESLSQINLLKTDVKSQSPKNFPSTTASNFWDCLTKSGEVYCRLFATVLDHIDSTGWGSYNNCNQNWGEQFNNANSITIVAWGDFANARTDYLPCISVNPCAA